MPDAVVIGAGPNGLVAANLLADRGWDVVVLEAQDAPGGAAKSAELVEPGFVNDVFSAFYPLGVAWDAEDARRAGTVHVAEGVDSLTVQAAQLALGLVPDPLFLIIGQQGLADPSRAPAGKQAVWAYTHVPQHVRGDAGDSGITGAWDEAEAEAMADRVEAEIELLAPGFRALVRGRHVLTPRSLEAADANLVGGATNGATGQLHQQLVFRPVAGLGRAETPVRGLFLGSSSAHPGGGVHGACGANAARAALLGDRLRLRRTRRT